jgi:hypothetical protein
LDDDAADRLRANCAAGPGDRWGKAPHAEAVVIDSQCRGPSRLSRRRRDSEFGVQEWQADLKPRMTVRLLDSWAAAMMPSSSSIAQADGSGQTVRRSTPAL